MAPEGEPRAYGSDEAGEYLIHPLAFPDVAVSVPRLL